MLKAFCCGIIILALSYIILFFAIWFDFGGLGILSFYFQIISPFVVAFIVAYLAPKRQIILGMTMILPVIILSEFFKLMCWFLDVPADYFDFSGEIIVAILYGVIYVPICFIGAFLGYFLYKYRHKSVRR